jgi:hypothetical protein
MNLLHTGDPDFFIIVFLIIKACLRLDIRSLTRCWHIGGAAGHAIRGRSARPIEIRMLLFETLCAASNLLCEERLDGIIGSVWSEELSYPAISAFELRRR